MDIIEQFKGFCSTPSLINNAKAVDYKIFEFPEITISSKLIKDLENLNHPRNSVLGKRMESFFEIAIKHSERYSLFDSNIQIISDKQTLGEIDFLVYDEQEEKPIHVELVYKLYIYDPAISGELSKWIGPNRRDSFPEKLKKLQERQFPLLKAPETLPYLQKYNLDPNKIHQELCFKAQVFLPESIQHNSLNHINPDCVRGNWYSFSEFRNKDWESNLFFAPKKSDWSIPPEKNIEWLNFEEILSTIQELFKRKKSPLIWMKTADSYSSFFIVWW